MPRAAYGGIYILQVGKTSQVYDFIVYTQLLISC